jgi:mono/diheme cytochrome c family protein
MTRDHLASEWEAAYDAGRPPPGLIGQEEIMRTTLVIISAAAFLVSSAAWAADSAYEANCAKCHGADGKADTPVGKAMKVPALITPEWAADDAPAKITTFVSGSDKHKAVAEKLSAEDLEAAAQTVQAMAAAGQN